MHRRSALRAVGAALAGGVLSAAPYTTGGSAADAAPARDDAFVPRSRLPLPGAKEAVVGPDGETVHVATTDGFASVDVSDPSAPSLLAERTDLLAEREDGPLSRVFDVAVDGDRLAVVGPANGRGLSGALVYDVGDPAAPQQVAFHETSFAIHNCDLSAGHVFLTGNDGDTNPLVVVDVRGGTPTEVARWSIVDADADWADVFLSARTLHDVTVADGVAYCAYWDAGTWMLDVSDPATPALLGSAGGFTPAELGAMSDVEKSFQAAEPPGNAHFADVGDDGTVLAVGGESWDGNDGDGHGGPSGIDLYDVSDPAAPERLATVEPLVPRDARVREGVWTTAHNFELTGGRLYSAWYQNGVKIHDVSDPANPEELAHWRDPDGTRFWTARLGAPGEFFVASDMGGRGENPEDAALYLFPDAAGTQPSMPAIETATPTPTETATNVTDSPTPTRGTPTTSPTPTPARTTSEPPATETTAPGLGAVGALGGLGVALWRRLRAHE